MPAVAVIWACLCFSVSSKFPDFSRLWLCASNIEMEATWSFRTIFCDSSCMDRMVYMQYWQLCLWLRFSWTLTLILDVIKKSYFVELFNLNLMHISLIWIAYIFTYIVIEMTFIILQFSFIFFFLFYLSAEFNPTQPVPSHTLHPGAEWGYREEFLVDAQSRWRKNGQSPAETSSLYGQQHKIPKKQRPDQRQEGWPPWDWSWVC